MINALALVGASVRDTKWGGTYTGTIVNVEDGWLFVQWHGTCIEDQLRADEVARAPDVPHPDDDGLRPMVVAASIPVATAICPECGVAAGDEHELSCPCVPFEAFALSLFGGESDGTDL